MRCRLCRYTGLTFAKNFIAVLTGILTGVICVLINRAVDILVSWRNESMSHLLAEHGVWSAFSLVFTYGLVLVVIAASMVCAAISYPSPCARLHLICMTTAHAVRAC
jgi:hypothetical protein